MTDPNNKSLDKYSEVDLQNTLEYREMDLNSFNINATRLDIIQFSLSSVGLYLIFDTETGGSIWFITGTILFFISIIISLLGFLIISDKMHDQLGRHSYAINHYRKGEIEEAKMYRNVIPKDGVKERLLEDKLHFNLIWNWVQFVFLTFGWICLIIGKVIPWVVCECPSSL